MSMKNPITPAGIEPATFRFVAQHLNHCATAVPETWSACRIISYMWHFCFRVQPALLSAVCSLSRRIDAWRYSDVSERKVGSVIMNGVLGREYCLTLK